jgi:hypothetical protein
LARLGRYKWKHTYVSHETRVQRPLLHPIEGPLCVAAWEYLGARGPDACPGDPW